MYVHETVKVTTTKVCEDLLYYMGVTCSFIEFFFDCYKTYSMLFSVLIKDVRVCSKIGLFLIAEEGEWL